MAEVTIIGGGLAGSEAAWQAAQRGVKVRLYEMRPQKMTPAHHSEYFAELVCTNSLGSNLPDTASGLLKEEMRRYDSAIIAAADASTVPAGGALAVDRVQFGAAVTKRLTEHPHITVVREEVTAIPADGPVVIATGPLTSKPLAEAITGLTGSEDLYFYDAAAPIITAESLDESRGFWGARYDKGDADYFNCVLEKDEYEAFQAALVAAEVHEGHIDEELRYFEGCMPIEVMAARGAETIRYGPMRPVGLKDPRTGKRPYAVVQLRKENRQATLLNLVGFQTRLRWGEQKRVFRLIPALAAAEFVRYGVIHRNTFVNSPRVLQPTYQTRARADVFLAGQITGVEGYVESAAAGLLAGANAARLAVGEPLVTLPPLTMMGALADYITSADPDNFQPMNANFGLLPTLERKVRDKTERRMAMVERALAAQTPIAATWREPAAVERT
ncbi:MAG TPA: FADH(2)-oxidizing methylenetetrahydrofolate--tRNA-(uracil(54)-C(5))-methyltransferase TrmFO [Limnochordia bacterium]|nr:FADH(2)-oxidizing methylenetetrahydrofolate--tRNA-(uracil(54)-C(5))-methyltransferase TrmFO [Limnochordia bacterium]